MPSHRPDFVSVVIVDTGRIEDTVASVASVERGDWPQDLCEIIVISGPTGAKNAGLASALGDRVRFVRTKTKTTKTTARNTGAAQARGQFIAFLEAGYEAEREWIRQAVKAFHSGRQIGAVASRIVADGGSEAVAERARPTESPTNGSALPKDLLFGERAALFVRSTVFEEAGGFDERLSEAYDDVDLGWRINLFGHRVRFAPSSAVHRVAPLEQPDESFSHQSLLERNALVVLYKNLDQVNLGGFLAGALGLAARRAVSTSGLRPIVADESSATADSEALTQDAISKGALAGLYGIDGFVELMGELATDRTWIQERRTSRDDAVLALFETSGISFGLGDSARPGAREIADALGIETPHGRVRVLVITGDLIGPRMAGPAIRAWNMCEQLALRNDVRLVSPIKATRASTAFQVFHTPDDRAIRDHEEWADVIVFQGYVLHQFRSLARSEKIMVADIYDPLHLEQLEQARDTRFEDWNSHVILASEVLNEQLARADFFLCASAKQRDFWLGQLAGVGRINAMTYEADNSLRDLLAIAPFGLDPEVPAQERHAIKGAVPGIGPDDKVLLWGGGIYDWFDTATLLRAMAKVVETHPDARLFFLGVAHPNPGVPVMKAQAATFELSDELGLTDRYVFFNREWVAFDDRHNYLLDADAGVSTHFEHIETAFSFRTRILDYMWARLPMVTTRGDGFADIIDSSPLGITVPERDVDALADAIISVLYDDAVRASIADAMDEVRDQFAWNHALEPLTTFCAAPRFAPDRNRSAHGHVMRMPDPVAAAIRVRHRGVGKVARLANHYFVREGPFGLARRIRDRLGL
jgi:glycosyltransferase involved in cell wall biosynthesis/GT2 family glycosyltransferase